MKAELIPENGDPPIPIVRDLSVVGRREYCDIRIDHPTISKRHCILVRTAGLLILRDLATTNGTKVKGQRVRWAALLPGDKLSIGGYKVHVYLGPDESSSPSERWRENPMMQGGFAAPTPPTIQPIGSDPPVAVPMVARAPAPTPKQAAPVPIVLDEADLVLEEEDDSAWNKMSFPKDVGGGFPIIDLD